MAGENTALSWGGRGGRSERKVRDGSVEKGVCHWFMEETDVHFKEKKKKNGRDS